MPKSPTKYCGKCDSVCMEYESGNVLCPLCRRRLNSDEYYFEGDKRKPLQKVFPKKKILFCLSCQKERAHDYIGACYVCKSCGKKWFKKRWECEDIFGLPLKYMPICPVYNHKTSRIKFSVPMPDITDLVSYHSEGHFIKEMLRQGRMSKYDNAYPDWVFWFLSIFGLPLRKTCRSRGDFRIFARIIDLHHDPKEVVRTINKTKIDVLFTTYRYMFVKLRWKRSWGSYVEIRKIDPNYYWKNIKAKMFWLPHSYDPAIYYPSSKPPKHDVTALGIVSDAYPLRTVVYSELPSLCKKHDWRLFSKSRPTFFASIKQEKKNPNYAIGRGYARVLRSSKVFIFGTSVLKYPIKKWFEGMGSGTCVLADKPQCAKELGFIDGENYVKITKSNWKRKLRWILSDEDERRRIAHNGWKLVQERHTHKIRVKQMFELLKSVE